MTIIISFLLAAVLLFDCGWCDMFCPSLPCNDPKLKKSMFRARGAFVRFKLLQTRQFCSKALKPTTTNSNNIDEITESNLSKYGEAYKQLDKLDFMTAAKILFTESPKTKKFGLDFHLVQLFFACMPSLAVFLVAQYARHDMKKMDAELEQKKKKEAEKAKELERKTEEEKAKSNPELLEMKDRLGKLEEAVKEIATESKKQSASSATRNQEKNGGKKQSAPTEADTAQGRPASSKSAEKRHLNEHQYVELAPRSVPVKDSEVPKVSGSAPVPDASRQGKTSNTQNGASSQDAKR